MSRVRADLIQEDAVSQALDNTVAIETPEHIRFRHFVAGPSRRLFAYVVDLVVRVLILVIVGLVTRIGAGDSDALKQMGEGLWMLALFAFEWVYFVLFETLANGRSPGKRALGLRVVKEQGEAISFMDAVLRNLLRAADFLPFGYALGVGSMLIDGRFRRLGDRVAATMVVIEEPHVVQTPLPMHPPPSLQELAGLPMRLPLSPEELVALDAFVRRPSLSHARRAELALMVAPLWAARVQRTFSDPVRFLELLHRRAVGSERHAPQPQTTATATATLDVVT